MPSDAPKPVAPRPVGPARRTTAAKQAAIALARACDFARAYGLEHPSVAPEAKVVEERLRALVEEFGGLELLVMPDGLLLNDQPLLDGPMARKGAVVAKPLFDEGVRHIVIREGVTTPELNVLINAWLVGTQFNAASQGMVTRFWEADLAFIELVVLDSFEASEDAHGDGTGVSESSGAAASQLSASMKDQIRSLVAMMSTAEAQPASRGEVQVSADDLALLRSEGLRDLSPEVLRRQEVTQLKLEEPAFNELETYARQVEAEHPLAARRFVQALSNAAVLSVPDDREALVKLFGDFVHAKAKEGQLQVALEAYEALLQAARAGDGLLVELRRDVLTRFRAAFTSARVVSSLVEALDDEATAPAAMSTLKMLGRSIVDELRRATAAATSKRIKSALLELLHALEGPRGSTIAQLRELDDEQIELWLLRFDALSDAEQLELVSRALSRQDAKVRRLGMSRLTRVLTARLTKAQLEARILDTDPEVRSRMLEKVTEAEHLHAVDGIAQLLARPGLPKEHRHAAYTALAAIKSPEAEGVLIRQLEEQSELETKVALVEALGRVKSATARATLEQLRKRLLISPKLRAAAKAALESAK